MVTEEEAETVGGWGEVSKTQTETVRGSQGIDAETLTEGTAAGRSNTWDVTSKAADEAGAVGRHGAIIEKRERVDCLRKNPAN